MRLESFLRTSFTILLLASSSACSSEEDSSGAGGEQPEEKEDLSPYDDELSRAEVGCRHENSSYDGYWFPNEDDDLSYSPITGSVEWIEGDDGSLLLIQEQQGTSAQAGHENLVKFEIEWEGQPEAGESARVTGRITGGEYGGFAVICVSGVARVGVVIDDVAYTTLVFDRFGEANADGTCEGAALPMEGLAYSCLSPPRY